MRASSIVACVLGSSCFSSVLLCCEEGVGKELGLQAAASTTRSGTCLSQPFALEQRCLVWLHPALVWHHRPLV